MANELVYIPSDLRYQRVGEYEVAGYMYVGKKVTDYTAEYHAACRFTNVVIPQGSSINSATLSYYVSYKGVGTGGNLNTQTYGIDEDNTSSFGSNPWGRDRTTAVTTSSGAMASPGNSNNFDVKNQVNEIVGRAGWSSGNAMGFLINNNSSSDDYWISDENTGSMLIIRLAAEPDFTPTPATVSAPTFPSATDFGIRVSAPGVDVKTATESQLYFTSRKKELRVNEERIIDAGTYSFSHGLGYAPCALGYNLDVDDHISIMNMPQNMFSVEAYIGANATNVILFPDYGAYVYVFIDPLT